MVIGNTPHGQGDETTFAQLVADDLGVPIEDVEVLFGDTDISPERLGHLREPERRGRVARDASGDEQDRREGTEDRRP